MMARVLDHKKVIEAMHLPADISGKATVAIHETEDTVTKLAIRLEEGLRLGQSSKQRLGPGRV